MKTKFTKGMNVYCESQPTNIATVVEPNILPGITKVNFGDETDTILRQIENKHLLVSKYSQSQLDKMQEAAPDLLKALQTILTTNRFDLVGVSRNLAEAAIKKATE